MKITARSKKKAIWTGIIASTVIIATAVAASTVSILSSSNQISTLSSFKSLTQKFSTKNLPSYNSLKFPVANKEIPSQIKAALSKQQISYDNSFQIVNFLNTNDNSVSYYEFSFKSKNQPHLDYGIYYIKNTGDKAEGLITFNSNEKSNISYTVPRILQIGLDMNNHLYILVSSLYSMPYGYVYFQKYNTKGKAGQQDPKISEMFKISDSIYKEMDLGGSSISDSTNNFILSAIAPKPTYMLTQVSNQNNEYQSQHIISNGDGTYTDDSNEVHNATVSDDSSNDIGTVSTIDYSYGNNKTTTLTATNVTTATTYNNKPQIFRLNPSSKNDYTSLSITDWDGNLIKLDPITAMYSSNQNTKAPIYLATKNNGKATIYIADNYDGSDNIKFKKITLTNTINDEITRFLETRDNNIYGYGLNGEIYNIQTGKELVNNIVGIKSFKNIYYAYTSNQEIYTYQNHTWTKTIGISLSQNSKINNITAIDNTKFWISTGPKPNTGGTDKDQIYVSNDGIKFESIPFDFDSPTIKASNIATSKSTNYSYTIIDNSTGNLYNSEDFIKTLNITKNGKPISDSDISADQNNNVALIKYNNANSDTIAFNITSKIYTENGNKLNNKSIGTDINHNLDPNFSSLNGSDYNKGNSQLTLVLRNGPTINYNIWLKSSPDDFKDNYSLTAASGYTLFGETNNTAVEVDNNYYPLLGLTSNNTKNNSNANTMISVHTLNDKTLTSSVQLGTLKQKNSQDYTFEPNAAIKATTLDNTPFDTKGTYQITLTDPFGRTSIKYLELGSDVQNASYKFTNDGVVVNMQEAFAKASLLGVTKPSSNPVMSEAKYDELLQLPNSTQGIRNNLYQNLTKKYSSSLKGFTISQDDFNNMYKFAGLELNFLSSNSFETQIIDANNLNLQKFAQLYVDHNIYNDVDSQLNLAKNENVVIKNYISGQNTGVIKTKSDLDMYTQFLQNYQADAQNYLNQEVKASFSNYKTTTLGWEIPNFSIAAAESNFSYKNYLTKETWNKTTSSQNLVAEHFNTAAFTSSWNIYLTNQFETAAFNPNHLSPENYLKSQISYVETHANLHGVSLNDVFKKAKITSANKPKNKYELLTNYDGKGMSYQSYLEKVSSGIVPTPPSDNTNDHNKLMYEIVIPVVAGGIIAIALAGLFIWLLVIKEKRRSNKQMIKPGKKGSWTRDYGSNIQRRHNAPSYGGTARPIKVSTRLNNPLSSKRIITRPSHKPSNYNINKTNLKR